MEITRPDTHKTFKGIEQKEEMSFTLVSELLRTILTDQNEEMLVEVRSQNFLYDQGSGLEAGRTLKTRIEYGTVRGTKEEVEIRLSGTVENHSGQKETCTLYFFMWWNHTVFSLTKKGNNFDKTIKRQTLLFELGNTSEVLCDSVFELDLYLKSLCGQKKFLGQGRGYLVFGR